MKRRTVIVSLLAFNLTLLGAIAPTLANGWEYLGERSVRLVTDRDVIPVRTGKQFARIKLEVKETGIQIFNMTVTLRNGRTIDVPLRQYISKNQQSRVIDLPGRDRSIRYVTLIYRSRPGSNERAIVKLYGKTR
ncbi:hypothetical protein ACE1B6_29625 [Aerosakkonemataceae cyanobacterium BLCC-F154]|uniref:DUF2541 family protein n=1 Tax=Floridaenema fluviatile BLCC-F154 TaxID=3153640 RepID=A0ABV4YMJ1_9CYAN